MDEISSTDRADKGIKGGKTRQRGLNRHFLNGLGGVRGGETEGAPKKDFGTIPYFLVTANYEKSFQYVALK